MDIDNGEGILAFEENEGGTSDVTDGECDSYGREKDVADDSALEAEEHSASDTDAEVEDESRETGNEREEYERLIKDRFKELFAEDVQRLINKRFKKYKALEEKVKRLEDEANKHADIDSLLAAERERAVRETEDRMNLQFKTMRGRAVENALSPRSARRSLDVSRLTKSERASLASRALKGEKIHL